jgi:NAD-dependent SIR2 family protein deacetylase
MAGTVVFLGAGATKSCGGPLTREILPSILRRLPTEYGRAPINTERIELIDTFLEHHFHVSRVSPDEHYPGLPLVMSLIDTALDRRQALGVDWHPERLVHVREALEFAIFDQLEEQLHKAPMNNHWQLMGQLSQRAAEPQVISTNYDVIADTALMAASEQSHPEGRLPDYGCQLSNEFYRREPQRFGVLLKLHGSLNWLYCRTCGRLELGASESQKYLKVLGRIVERLESAYSADGQPCPSCGEKLRPLLIAPTHLKNYRNPHVAQVWYEAERILRAADRVIFAGYSLPDDDVEVVYLLKRSLGRLDGSCITVVEHDKNPMIDLQANEVGRRYRALFGSKIRWWAGGFDGWLNAGAPGID